jgi:AAA family ATP:ADP antiporter
MTAMGEPQLPVARKRGALETVLGLFTEVRPGETRTVLLLTLNIFLILVSYYIIKPVREALILSAPRGAELKSYTSAGQTLLLLLVAVPAYALLASRVSRRRLLNTVNLFFVANLVLFYLAVAAIGQGHTALGVGFFLWVGIFNLMVPTQLWSLANDVYTPEEGKRLFVIIVVGGSTGAAVGGVITRALIDPLGLNQMLLLSAAVLFAATVLMNVVEARESRRRAARLTVARPAEAPLSRGGAFLLVLRTRYLLLIGLLMTVLNWVNTNGEFILGNAVEETYKRQAAVQLGAGASEEAVDEFVGKGIGKFYAGFYTNVNVVGLVVQLFVVSRLVRFVGIRGGLMILPAIALGGYTLLAFAPLLGVIRWVKTAENATDYSLQNTVRHALFLPTTREEKYKAKQATDTFFWRAGDLLSTGLVYVGLNRLQLSTQGFAAANMALVAGWMILALAIGREYQRRTRASATG